MFTPNGDSKHNCFCDVNGKGKFKVLHSWCLLHWFLERENDDLALDLQVSKCTRSSVLSPFMTAKDTNCTPEFIREVMELFPHGN